VVTHFNTSTKCIHPSYNEEMHGSWWSFARIVKLGTIMVAKQSMLKTSRLKLPKHYIVSPKGFYFLFS